MKGQVINWEQYLQNTYLIEDLYPKYTKLNKKKTNNPILKWSKDLNRYFTKEDIQMRSKQMKKMLNLVCH